MLHRLWAWAIRLSLWMLYNPLAWAYDRVSYLVSDGLWHECHLLPTPEEQVMVLRLPKTPPLDLELPLSAEWREGEVW